MNFPKPRSHLIPGSKHCSSVSSENPLHCPVQSLVQPHPLPPRHSEKCFLLSIFSFYCLSPHTEDCISGLIIPFPDFPIKVPGFGRFNAATEYVWTRLPREFHCLENGFNQSWGSDKYEVWWAGILIHTSSDDNCSIALGSNGFPALSSLPSLKSWTILLP